MQKLGQFAMAIFCCNDFCSAGHSTVFYTCAKTHAGTASWGQILQVTMLVQTTDGSMERHFFSGCSSLLNKVIKLHPDRCDWFWTITNPICTIRLYFIPKITCYFSNLRFVYRTKCSLFVFLYMGL